MEEKLLPCPFCGAAAELKQEADHHGEFYNLGCSDDKCLAHHVCYTWTPEDMPVEQAVSKWNTRSDSAALAIGEARGRVLGMGEALGAVRLMDKRSRSGEIVIAESIVDAIRQAAAQPAEVCEWVEIEGGYRLGCGVGHSGKLDNNVCSNCGKPIKVKGESGEDNP